MDDEQARAILRAAPAPHDPLAAEALAHVRRDPTLSRWLENERAVDAAIASQLRAGTAPAGLKAAILASVPEATRAAHTPRRTALSLAALIIILAGCVAVWLPIVTARPDSLASFRSDMGEILSDSFRFHFQSSELAALQSWLATQHGIQNYQVPPHLAAQTRPVGCRTFDWNGKKVALLCFYTSDGRVIHLSMLPRDAVYRAPTTARPRYARRGSWTSSTWISGDTVYFVMSPLSESDLRALL